MEISIIDAVQFLIPIIVGIVLYNQNLKIDKVQQAEIKKLTEDFNRQSTMFSDVQKMLSLYKVDVFKEYVAFEMETNDKKHKAILDKIENTLEEKEIAQRELLRLCIDIVAFANEDNRMNIIDTYFPNNKDILIPYLKKLKLI